MKPQTVAERIMIYDIYIYLRQNGGMFNCTPDFLVKNMEVFLFNYGNYI